MEIPLLNKNKEIVALALCSAKDIQMISAIKWHLHPSGYAKGPNNSIGFMHIFIMKKKTIWGVDSCVDHINGNKLDNTIENLRIVLKKENSQNKSKKISAKSKYFGVAPYKNGRFQSGIGLNGKRIYLGYFDNEIDAAVAHDRYLAHHIELHHKMNFPEKREEYMKQTLENFGKYKKRSEKLIIKTNMIELDTNVIRILINNSPESIVIIDKEDYEKVKHYNCFLSKKYIQIVLPNCYKALHRHIMNVDDSAILVDHINSNPLDNRKVNLRQSNKNMNAQNRSKTKNETTSKFIGVSITQNNTWSGEVKNNSIKKSKRHKTEEEAARWRDLYIKKHLQNSYYKMNFEWTTEEEERWTKILNM